MSNYKRYFSNISVPVFITFVTYNRRNILIQNINLFKKSLKFVKEKYKLNIIAISVMKNHCHMILSVIDSKKIPNIIKDIKIYFSKNIPDNYISYDLSNSALKRGEKGVWQRRYYDHIIRNEQDLYKHIDYIHFNSMKHYNIVPKDWKYSSFIKYVRNGYYNIDWANLDDKNQIKFLNYE